MSRDESLSASDSRRRGRQGIVIGAALIAIAMGVWFWPRSYAHADEPEPATWTLRLHEEASLDLEAIHDGARDATVWFPRGAPEGAQVQWSIREDEAIVEQGEITFRAARGGDGGEGLDARSWPTTRGRSYELRVRVAALPAGAASEAVQVSAAVEGPPYAGLARDAARSGIAMFMVWGLVLVALGWRDTRRASVDVRSRE